MTPQIARRIFASVSSAFLTLVTMSAHASQPPTAVATAGSDPGTGQASHSVTLYIGPSDTGRSFTVSGAGSSDPDDDPLRYVWQCADDNGNRCLMQMTVVNVTDVRMTFPAGTFYLTLTVSDPGGASSSDTARVKVLVDINPPSVTPPDDDAFSATESGGARGSDSSKLHDFLFNSATATDNSTSVFHHLPPQINGVDVDDNTLLPHGTTTVTFRIADVYDNVGSATADVSITDLHSGDLFVGVQSLGATQFKGGVQRIRGGSVTDYCLSPDPTFAPAQSGEPVFWNRPDQIVVDSKGRVAFLAPLNYGTTLQPSIQNGWGLLRCNRPGEPAEQLGVFPTGSYIDPGWFEPLPGKRFYAPGLPPSQPLTGLHLRKVKYIRIDDDQNNGNPEIVTDERYVFAYHESSIPDNTVGTIGNLSLNTNSLDWDHNDLELVAVGSSPDGPQNMLPEMFYHSKTETVSFLGIVPFPAPVAKTYVTRFGTLRRVHQPFEVHLTAGGVRLGVQAFFGALDIPGNPGIGGIITDDVTIPNAPSGCNPSAPIRGDWPQRLGGYSTLQTDGVIFERNSGLVINSGFSMPGWTGDVSESLFDLNSLNDRDAYFAVPEIGCIPKPVVNFRPLAGGVANPAGSSVADLTYDLDPTGWGFHPDRMAASPDGLFGTQGGSPYTGVTTGRVVKATGSRELTEVATGLIAPKGLGAFPPQLGNVQISALIVRIDSPVDVVLTDAIGRRVGVMDGQEINEFAEQAHDTGAAVHPRLYIIRYPQAGAYSLRSVGTGSGPFTVHVYSVDSEKKVTEHISHTGAAQPGSTDTHDFALNESAHVAFANATPMAHAGFDQTADADASGNATVALDGSLSSDPDGDALTFRWAGPFGVLSGAQVNATLPAGVHVIKLTVDDGKGGSGDGTVQLTVNAVTPPGDTTPPVLTLPANILVQAPSSAGAVVNFTATASDNVDGGVPVICVPAAGATFAVGTTTVSCSASDRSNNSATGTFTVTVTPAPSTPCAQVTFTLVHESAVLTQVHATLIDRRTGAVFTFDASIGVPQSVPAGRYRLELTAPAGYEVRPEHKHLKLKCGEDRRLKLNIRAVPPPKQKGKEKQTS